MKKRTRICRIYMKEGMCKNQLDNKECPFAHGTKELTVKFKP